MDRNGAISDDMLRLGMRRGRRQAGYWFDSRTSQGPDDLVQEALIRAWGYWPKLRCKSRFPAVVCTIVRRMRHQLGVRPSLFVGIPEGAIEGLAPRNEPPGIQVNGEWVDRSWLRDQLMPMLARQQPLNRELLMAYHEGFSCSELSDRYGLSLDAVKTRLHRTRQRLRVDLERLVLLKSERSANHNEGTPAGEGARA